MPSEIIRAPEHSRRRSLGWLLVRWQEHFCIHGPGDIAGRPLNIRYEGAIPLSDELTMLTVDAYALDPNGRRLYDSVFYSRPKGCDKSGQSARFGMCEGLGPCRFGGWAEGTKVFDWGTSKGEIFEQMDFRYEYQAGEAMGRPVTHPFLRIMATEETQTGHVYDAIYMNLHDGPLRAAFNRLDDIGLTRVYLPNGGEIRPSTASSSARDGGKESWASFDETHLYVTPELRRMYATVRRNLTKRKDASPWSFEPSTMYEPGRNSVAEASHQLAQDIRDGKMKLARLLFDHREAPADTDLDDEKSLRAGLLEAYGDAASYMDMDRKISEIWDPRNARSDSIRFSLNRANAASSRAFDLAAWRRNARPDIAIDPNEAIALGFDGSRYRDSTSLKATHIKTGFQWTLGLWEKDPNDPEWEVPEDEVDAAVDEAFATYRVVRFYLDPSKWETAAARWAGRYNHDPDVTKAIVVKWPVQLHKKTAVAAKAYANAIIAGEVLHDGNPKSTQHIANCYRAPQNYTDDDGSPLWLPRKETEMSPHKVDDAYAGMLSWQARNDAIAAGLDLEPKWHGIYVPA